MSKHYFEILLFATVAINAALLLFLAGVFRNMVNSVDEAVFKNLIDLLVRYSKKSPYMIIVLNLPLLVAIPYFICYGFTNSWVTCGIALWLIAGSLTKFYKLPVYKAIAKLKNDDEVLLKKERRKFNLANTYQAALYSVATLMMLFGLQV